MIKIFTVKSRCGHLNYRMDTLTSEELFSAVNVIKVFSSTGNVNKVTVLVFEQVVGR